MGRRMTHEHNMLQKMRAGGNHSRIEARHSVPPSEPPMYENHESIGHRRISVLTDASTSQVPRPRSNAVFREELTDLRTSSSANFIGDRVYGNIGSRTHAPDGHDSSSLPTSPTHQFTSPERCYYNMSQYPRADEANPQRIAALSGLNDSDDDDDDFVNVVQSIQSKNDYYNLRDALATRSVPATDDTGRQLNYENFVPAANKHVVR